METDRYKPLLEEIHREIEEMHEHAERTRHQPWYDRILAKRAHEHLEQARDHLKQAHELLKQQHAEGGTGPDTPS